MANQPTEQRAPDETSEEDVDAALEDTFPASDPPSTGGVTRNETDQKLIDRASESDVPGTEPDEDIPDEETPAEPSPGDLPAETPPDQAAPQSVAHK
jgi:hypothetical protein